MLLITVNFCFSNNVSFNKAGESYKNGLFSNGSYVIELSKEYNNIHDVILEKDIIFNSFIDSVFGDGSKNIQVIFNQIDTVSGIITFFSSNSMYKTKAVLLNNKAIRFTIIEVIID